MANLPLWQGFSNIHACIRKNILKPVYTEAKLQQLDSSRKAWNPAAKKMREMSDDERARYLSKLVVLNEENIRQVLSEVIWL